MVSTIKYRSFKDMKFRGGQHITYLVWGILALMLVAAWPQVMLFVIFAGYALLGPAERLGQLLSKMAGKRTAPKPEQSASDSKF
jgi:CDP-diacylglycerol--serine O-phosphatidyltransferase